MQQREPSRGSIPPAHNKRVGRAATEGRTRSPKKAGGTSPALASVLGFAAAATVAGGLAWPFGCKAEPPPGATATDAPSRTSSLPTPPSTSTSAQASAEPVGAKDAGAPGDGGEVDKPYSGPLLGGLALQTPIYTSMDFKSKRLGYIRHGGKAPVDPRPTKNEGCSQGWYHLLDGGYVCGKYATTDMSNPQVKLGITPPTLDDVLPYRYAINTAHGTPLYRSVPSKEDMIRYEPYLEMAKRANRRRSDDDDPAAAGGAVPSGDKPSPEEQAADKMGAVAQAAAIGLVDGGVPAADDPAQEPEKPWWQKQYDKGKGPDVKLTDLESDSDSTIAKRMVKGFFISIDKTFGWNNRLWYKTTDGLVAPADRMYIAKPPTSQGIDVPAGVKQVGFITALKGSKYDYDADKKTVSVSGPIARFAAFGLTSATISVQTIVFRQTTEGWWMKGIDGTFTEPGPAPADLAPGEKWIDVNLTRKTLMAFEGDRPVYAALVSPGKKSKIKEKDHSTVKGTFR
ncbi:MAG TPA: L,D-transpeptidase, partial [Polyangiaceae bacterium]